MPAIEDKVIIIIGGGLTGLTAGYVLTNAGASVKLFEKNPTVGGLCRTVVKNEFRFDLGGHRFFTKNERMKEFVKNLMVGELISVPRKSKILLRSKYFDYPLKPMNAIFGMGIKTTIKILSDYFSEKIKELIYRREKVSIEDWVVSNFGRTMFNIYFKEYSEKVWGMNCSLISADWVAQRISGLSLSVAIKNAIFRFGRKNIPSLVDRFLYPELGIGRIAERLEERIRKHNEVFTGASVKRINHSGFKVKSIEVKTQNRSYTIYGNEIVSSIPVTELIKALDPPPPEDVLDAVSKLRFRDLVVVAIMVNRKRVTDLTWIYIPEREIPFGRIHEPVNWSEKMVPSGKTVLVAEFFSFKGDEIWNESDDRLTDITVKNLERLGFIKEDEVVDSVVVRAEAAYPLFTVGYSAICDKIYGYLARFENLHTAGRVGMFRYYNMDRAIESGMDAAERIIKKA